jgi:ATP-binding cassette subfamily C (CFTR/MRP) protein 4
LIAKGWPEKGEVVFDNLSMKYREFMEPSIKDLNCTVKPGMKIGIVGRTGAGKSSILQVLFRLTDAFNGVLMIDGEDLCDIGLHLLRKNIAYIPQMPFMLQGTIRENLDPFNQYDDEMIEATLKEVSLYEFIYKKCPNKLETNITEGNNVFSSGQKQLLCLGRAIIKKTKILVLDEATANVDLETDNFIQNTLKSSF